MVFLVHDFDAVCAFCQESLIDTADPYELPRYKPDIPRKLCNTCKSGFLTMADLVNSFIKREEKECAHGS